MGNIDLWLSHKCRTGPITTGRWHGQLRRCDSRLGASYAKLDQYCTLNRAQGHSISWSGNACDLNNDGNPELLAASYGRAPNHLWLAGSAGYNNESIDSGYA